MTWTSSLIVIVVVLFLIRLWKEYDKTLRIRERRDPKNVPTREKEKNRDPGNR